MTEEIGTPERPIYMKWVMDDDSKPRWGNILLMAAVGIGIAYFQSSAQRAGSDADALKTVRLKIAQKRIAFGHKLQRTGKAMEEGGWESYERLR